MPHETPNPHDTEEQLRPFLGDLFEAQDGNVDAIDTHPVVVAYDRALGKALQLLGVQR